MFLDEARIAAGVHHPNVTEIYELGEEGHVLYLAMEWVNGESLVHVVRGLNGQGVQPIDPRVAARIAAESCAGLHAAHELRDDRGAPLNVVHRDVSPHNILVSIDGTVKVTDFGVAKALGQSHQATVAGQIKGKVAYMAPEIIGSAAFDRRSDVFAVGCVLYEAATGTMPFRGGNDPQVMQAILKGTYPPAPSVVRGFPLELAAIIDCAMATDPRRRFGTAEQMRVALEEWLVKSGPLVSPTNVGALVRERLGPHLDKRRDHVRSAMASAQEQETRGAGGVRPAAGALPPPHTPALLASPAGQSHSGVVATSPDAYRARAPIPPMTSPTPAPVAVTAPPPLVNALPSVHPPPRRQTSNARYALAAVAGVTFAMVVGALGVAVWASMRTPAARTTPSTLVATASARPAPPPPAASTAKAGAPSATPIAAVAVPSASPTTVNVNDLPEAKPAWAEPLPQGGRWAAPPASAKNPAIPANPY
jgi:serine/threonine-protein kinase